MLHLSRVDNLLSFYRQNRDNIYIPKEDVGKYSPNKKNIEIWREAIKNGRRNVCDDASKCDTEDNTETYLIFADFFIEGLRYIPFNEMLEKISLISKTINKMAPNYDCIFLFIDDALHKSNTWVALLFVGELLKLNFFTSFENKLRLFSKTDDLIKSFDDDTVESKYLILHFDDMSYSGMQMFSSSYTQAMLRNRFIKLRDDYEKVLEFHWYACVPYVASKGREKLKNRVLFFNETEIIFSLQNQIEKNELQIPIDKIRKLLGLFYNNESFFYGRRAFGMTSQFKGYMDKSVVYFDHKLADSISVYQKILTSGSFPAEVEDCKYIPLINNCVVDPYGGKACGYVDPETDIPGHDYLEKDIPNDKACPKNFYKNIVYTYNGVDYRFREDNGIIITDLLDLPQPVHSRLIEDIEAGNIPNLLSAALQYTIYSKTLNSI